MSPASRPGWLSRATAHRREFGLRATVRLLAENVVHALSPRLARTLRRWDIHCQNVAFDRRHGTRTVGASESAVPEGGGGYEPTDEASFAWMTRALDLDWPRFTFVDLGSGKGKALLLASRLPFRRLIGVEYDAELHEIARHNVRAFSGGEEPGARIDLVHGDASTWTLPEGDVFLYMFNPFSGELVRSALENARRSLLDEPRRIIVAYYNVTDPGVFQADWLEPLLPSRDLPIGSFQAWRISGAAAANKASGRLDAAGRE